MAVNQSFDKDQAHRVAIKIKREAETARTAMATVESQISGMKSWWKGESSVAFEDQFNRLKPNLNKLVELVNSISVQIDQVARAKEEAEKSIANALKRG